MNIFYLDEDPVAAATYLCDKHVPKMALEAAQIMATTLHLADVVGVPKRDGSAYKPTHAHHPCRVWAGASRGNYLWLGRHGLAICDEHLYRGGRPTVLRAALEWAMERAEVIPEGGMTPPAMAVKDTPAASSDVETYRAFYRAYKAGIARWAKGRSTPAWWQGGCTFE